MNKLSLDDLELKDKTVVMRVDYNVPMRQDEADQSKMIVTNTQRIDATMPTIKAIFDRGAKVLVLLSHLGRPDGRVVPSMSLQHVVGSLQHAVGESHSVHFVAATVGDTAEKAVANATPGTIVLLENVRFHREEQGKGKDEEGKSIKAPALL